MNVFVLMDFTLAGFRSSMLRVQGMCDLRFKAFGTQGLGGSGG